MVSRCYISGIMRCHNYQYISVNSISYVKSMYMGMLYHDKRIIYVQNIKIYIYSLYQKITPERISFDGIYYHGVNILRGDALGITGEQGGLADVAKTQEEHDHTLETDTTTGVRVGAELE